MEPIILVHKNTGYKYETSEIVLHKGISCYELKYSNGSTFYIPLSEVGQSYEPGKDYYIEESVNDKDTEKDREEDLFLVDETHKLAYKIICLCMKGGLLSYKIDTPRHIYISKSAVDNGCYSIKTKAEVDKMQEAPRRELGAMLKVDQAIRLGHYNTYAKSDGVYIKLIVPGNITEALIYPFKTQTP